MPPLVSGRAGHACALRDGMAVARKKQRRHGRRTPDHDNHLAMKSGWTLHPKNPAHPKK